MFRLANCNELISLKCKYSNFCFNDENAWGLKQMGTLFCVDTIMTKKAKIILELGGGNNLFFDRRFGDSHEYWMLDRSGFYEAKTFQASQNKRKNTSFVDGLIGDFIEKLPNDYFDLVFSISVLEHVLYENIDNVCKDMYRVLKPGGYIVHSLDLDPKAANTQGKKYLDCLKDSGFVFEQLPSDLEWEFNHPDKITLLEPLSIVYKYYYRKKDDLWSNPKTVYTHYGTILVLARKPE